MNRTLQTILLITFTTVWAAGAAGQPPENGGGEPKLSFNFRFAPWSDVLKWYAERAGLSLDLNDVPQGTFNYFDSKQYSVAETLDVLNGYLLPKGYMLVRRDNFLVSLNLDQGIPPNLVPNVEIDEVDGRGRNELLSVVLPLEGVAAKEAAAEVEKLVGPLGRVAALEGSNALVITDVGSNLRRIRDLFTGNGRPRAERAGGFRAFPLRHIGAGEAERFVQTLIGVGGQSGPQAKIMTDPRTNSLLVTGPASTLASVEELIQAVDVPVDSAAGTTDGAAGRSGYNPGVRVLNAPNLDPVLLRELLGALMPKVKVSVTESPRTTESPPAPMPPPEAAQPAAEENGGRNKPPPAPIQNGERP